MTDIAPNPQAPIAGVPEGNGLRPAPYGYVAPAAVAPWLGARFPQFALSPQQAAFVSEGLVLAASMTLDEEAPFMGVKENPTQERQSPRTFRYGWPNVIAAPTPIMVAMQFAGAWNL